MCTGEYVLYRAQMDCERADTRRCQRDSTQGREAGPYSMQHGKHRALDVSVLSGCPPDPSSDMDGRGGTFY